MVKPVDTLAVDRPAFTPQLDPDPRVTPADPVSGNLTDAPSKIRLIVGRALVPVRGTREPEHTTYATFAGADNVLNHAHF